MLKGLQPGSTEPEYAGGMTESGVANVGRFVAAGGTLVALDSASELPLATLPVLMRDVTRNQRDSVFFIPGTLLRLQFDNANPVAFGMPPEAPVFFASSPVFGVGRTDDDSGGSGVPETVKVIGRYPSRSLLMSGWLLGEQVLAGRAALVEASVEQGRVVMIGFRTQHRAQTHGTFKILFNSIYLSAIQPAPGPARPSVGKTRQGRRLR